VVIWLVTGPPPYSAVPSAAAFIGHGNPMNALDPKTIQRGRAELAQGLAEAAPTRQRRPGGGRPPAEKKIPA